MCEYCGCQALETIDELTQEHDEVVRLISHLRPVHQEGGVARALQTRAWPRGAGVTGPCTQAIFTEHACSWCGC